MTAITLAGVLVVGVVIGSLLARAATSSTGGAVTADDYVLLVARLYQRERSVFNAQERLVAQGIKDPAATVADLAKWYRAEQPTATAEIASLDELAQALDRLNESTSPPPAAAESPEKSGGLNVIPLVIVLVIGAVGLIAARMKGPDLIRVIGQTLDGLTAGKSVARVRTAFAANGTTSASTSRSPEEPDRPVEDELTSDDEPVLDDFNADDHLSAPRSVIVRPLTTPPDVTPKSRPVTVRSDRSRYTFRFSYELGDADYEELHPVRERGGDRLLGVCCLSAALASPNDGGVYAFTAWVHDYESQELRSVGLVTAWSLSSDLATIERWMEESVVDERLVLDRGATIKLETRNLSVVFEVVDCDLIAGEPRPPVARLAVRAEVVNRALAAAVNGRS